MTKYGFKVYKNEWWHFDFVGWENYPLMDIPFEKL
jgi:D-alanyl-D-alanine dipeptidase